MFSISTQHSLFVAIDISRKEQRNSSIEIYRSPEGNIELNVKLENDTVWLTQSQMAELFGRDRTVISRHVNNCFKEGELDKSLVCAKFAHTKKYGRHDGFEQVVETEYYNLDVIISVGYRVKSINGTRFRQWANSILKQYIIKGYAINQKRLDNYNELKEVVRLMSRAITFTRVKNYTRSQLVQKMHKFLLYLYMIFGKNVYLCMQNEENGHIISIFPVADLRCRLYAIALSSFVRRNRRYG